MKRKGSAVWQGSLKEGKGTVSTESGVLKGVNYSFSKRFGDESGTNPEELVAAAHAGCFSMAFSGQLGEAGITPDSVSTTATATFEKTDAGFTVTGINLETVVKAPGADKAAVEKAAGNAKAGCPISRLLNTNINLDLKIEA